MLGVADGAEHGAGQVALSGASANQPGPGGFIVRLDDGIGLGERQLETDIGFIWLSGT